MLVFYRRGVEYTAIHADARTRVPLPTQSPPRRTRRYAPNSLDYAARMTLRVFNQQQRFLRVFLFLGIGSGMLALASGTVALFRRDTPNGVPMVAAFLLALFAVTMLISAAATVPSARRAGRLIAGMQGSEALAHWVYSPPFWRAWVLADRRGLGKFIWGGSGVVAVLGAIIVAALISTPATTGPVPWGVVMVMATITIGTILIIMGGMFAYRRRRTRRLLACGECWLLNDAVYIGGDFAYWNFPRMGKTGFS